MFYFCLRDRRPEDRPDTPEQGFRWPLGNRRAESCSSHDLLRDFESLGEERAPLEGVYLDAQN